jgi:hypothetical protein
MGHSRRRKWHQKNRTFCLTRLEKKIHFDMQGKTIDSDGKLVWSIEDLADDRIVISIMSVLELIRFKQTNCFLICKKVQLFISFCTAMSTSSNELLLQLPKHGRQETQTVSACYQERSRSQWF